MVPEQPLGEKLGAELGVLRGTSASSRVQGRTMKQMLCTVQGLRQKLDESIMGGGGFGRTLFLPAIHLWMALCKSAKHCCFVDFGFLLR